MLDCLKLLNFLPGPEFFLTTPNLAQDYHPPPPPPQIKADKLISYKLINVSPLRYRLSGSYTTLGWWEGVGKTPKVRYDPGEGQIDFLGSYSTADIAKWVSLHTYYPVSFSPKSAPFYYKWGYNWLYKCCCLVLANDKAGTVLHECSVPIGLIFYRERAS